MIALEDIQALWHEKSWRKLSAISIVIVLIITVLVFFAAFELCRTNYLEQMDDYLDEIPVIIENFRNELQLRSRIYEEDALVRAELGMKLFAELDELPEDEKLERVRASVSADSVSLMDENRQMISTTGPVSPDEIFQESIETLETREPYLALYPAASIDGEKTSKNDGKGLVLIPEQENTKHSLVFEFSCEPILEMHNKISDWSNILERMLYKASVGAAFAKSGNELSGFPLNDLKSEQKSQLYDELPKIFSDSARFQKSAGGNSNKVIKLLGEYHLAALMHYPQENTDILLTFPLEIVIGNGFFIAAAISAIIGWGIVLIRIYIFRCLCRDNDKKDLEKISRKQLFRETWPGLLVMILVTIIFSAMLFLLENRTNATYTAITQRESLQAEINYCDSQEKIIRSTYTNFYRTRSQLLANYLMEHPDQQTQESLSELNRIAGTIYLMRFDSDGHELASSNSYTNFSVGKNLSEEYQAVLMGYPDVVVGPEADPHTGQMQIGTAIMMTNAEGQPDGFLLAVYSAKELNTELQLMSYESAINIFPVQKGHSAAAINDADGRFIAHTDPEMIGQKAVNYLDDYEPGNSFEGFTAYKNKPMCISANAADGKTLLFMVPERWNSYDNAGFLPPILALAALLLLALVYYPTANVLIAQAVTEAKKKLNPGAGKGSRLKIFYDGYDYFITIFTFFVLLASVNGWWTSFDYVLSGKWSKGLNLYAVWAALLILAITACIVKLIGLVLNLLESRLSLQASTICRLIRSLLAYTAIIFLIFSILDLLGVNTTALLASAGVLSIAIGMGAKSMAEDMLAGFFMITEGTVHVGDLVSVGGVTGRITDMGIRTTEITDDQGNVVILNNSKVSAVRNMSRSQTQDHTENS